MMMSGYPPLTSTCLDAHEQHVLAVMSMSAHALLLMTVGLNPMHACTRRLLHCLIHSMCKIGQTLSGWAPSHCHFGSSAFTNGPNTVANIHTLPVLLVPLRKLVHSPAQQPWMIRAGQSQAIGEW
jgi:hypothetical protein